MSKKKNAPLTVIMILTPEEADALQVRVEHGAPVTTPIRTAADKLRDAIRKAKSNA